MFLKSYNIPPLVIASYRREGISVTRRICRDSHVPDYPLICFELIFLLFYFRVITFFYIFAKSKCLIVNIMKKLFIFLFLFFISFISYAAFNFSAANADGIKIYYKFTNGDVFVGNSAVLYSGDIVIPETVEYRENTYIVTGIDASAFSGSKGLTSISIPNSVTYIGDHAFKDCSGLTSTIIIPDSVTSIGAYAFYGCTGLTSITIPKNVKEMGSGAFANCTNLKTIVVDKENPIFDSRDNCNGIIETASNTLIFGYGNTVIPESVTSIGKEAFTGNTDLSSFIIPNSIKTIGEKAFYYCNNLRTIDLGDGVTYIGDYAFSGCNSLRTVDLGDGVTYIGEKAFQSCSGLKSIVIPESVTNIGSNAFWGCPRLSDIYACSTEPADCYGRYTFTCGTDETGGREVYDVYDYAVLHVPMGTKEKYATAYEWRYFKKIKEDLEINGHVFYTTLSVNQAGEGYVQHYVKADEPYTIFIGSDEGLRINTVMFNGEDVTDRLVDGYYTTPNITHPSKISISFEQSTDNVRAIADDNLHVYGNDGNLYVAGIEGPKDFSVFTLDGKLVESRYLEGDTRLDMNDGVYIVKVGERTFKVSM